MQRKCCHRMGARSPLSTLSGVSPSMVGRSELMPSKTEVDLRRDPAAKMTAREPTTAWDIIRGRVSQSTRLREKNFIVMDE